jgi:hypothetical protein
MDVLQGDKVAGGCKGYKHNTVGKVPQAVSPRHELFYAHGRRRSGWIRIIGHRTPYTRKMKSITRLPGEILHRT